MKILAVCPSKKVVNVATLLPSTHLIALGHLEVGRGEEELGREVLLLLVNVDVALLAAEESIKKTPDVGQHVWFPLLLVNSTLFW